MKRNDNTPLNVIEKVNSRISLLCSILVLIAAALLLAMLDYRMIKKPALDRQKRREASSQFGVQKDEETLVTTASVIAVGDNLYHTSTIEAGISPTGEYNYDFLYKNVLDEIQAADIAIADQETVITSNREAISSYPMFRSPVEAAEGLVTAGFNVIYQATNHVDDAGLEGLQETLDFWKNRHPEITLLGIHSSEEDAEGIKVREVNGIRIAFLEYTYGTNMAHTEGIEDYMIDKFSKGRDKVSEMIQKAKAMSDCIIFIAHWGTEDEPMPTEYEKQWATFLMQQGVNVVIGGHPHVLQPYGRLMDDQGHDMAIFYSLGNFVSNMNLLPEVVEGMASFTIEKTVRGDNVSIRILDQTVKPMVMHYDMDRSNPAVYMLEDYTEELASRHGTAAYMGEGVVSLKNMYRQFEEIMSMNVEPSTDTDMLNSYFAWDGSMYDLSGNYIYDGRSISEYQYYGRRNINISDYTSDEEIDYTAGN